LNQILINFFKLNNITVENNWIYIYRVVSILTVFVNKALLSGKEVNLNAPMFVTWYQCIVSTAICFAMSTLSKIFPHLVKFPEGTPLDTATMWKVYF